MRIRDMYSAMSAAYRAYEAAIRHETPGSERYRALRRIRLALDTEMTAIEKAQLAASSKEYAPRVTAIVSAKNDLEWSRKEVDSFAAKTEQLASILAFVAGILPLL